MDHTHHPLPDSPPAPEDTADHPLLAPSANIKPSSSSADITKPPSPAAAAMTRTSTKAIGHIIQDILYCHNERFPIHRTYFYKVVLGGHVDTVKQVIQNMEQADHFTALSWLLGTNKESVYRKHFRPIKALSRLRFARYGIFTVTALLSVLLSPVFYIVHGLLSTMLQHKGQSLLTHVELPLAFAAFSQSPDMVQFFYSKNVSLKSTDNKGNNVFHYIANLSITSSMSACAAFGTIMDHLQSDLDKLYNLLYVKRNDQGYTAMEYAARFGSPSLLEKMINAEPRFRQIRFSVTDEGVMLKPFRYEQSVLSSMSSLSTNASEDFHVDHWDRQTTAAVGKTREDFINVTMYENQNIAQRSLLLRLIAGRNFSSFSVKDLTMFQKCPVVGKWIQLKIKEMRKYIVSMYLLDLVVTVVFLYVLFLMHGTTNLTLQLSKQAMRVELEEYEARASGSSNILTPSALQDVMEKQVLDFQLHWILDHVKSAEPIEELIKSELQVDVGESGGVFNLNRSLQHSVVDTVLQIQPQVGYILALQDLSQIVSSSVQSLLERYQDLAQRDISTNNLHKFENTVQSFILDFVVHDENVTVKLSDIMSFADWRNMICLPASNLPPNAFQKWRQPSAHFPDDICSWHSLLLMAEGSCEPATPVQVYERLDEILTDRANQNTSIEAGIILMVVMAIIYVMIDTFEHLLFFYMVIKANKSVLGIIMAICTTRVPGSYYRKQLNIITYYIVICHLCARSDLITSHLSSVMLEKATYYLLLFGLILRFIMHIHCMRLLPWIGHFVITTFMMASNLIHFSTILGLVIFIFSLIFHLLIVDKDCPIQRYDGYETIWESMLSVFMLTFGHGDFDQYRSNSPVAATYTLFVIIVGLLLLNLIIAIMSATATDVMTAEGKVTLRNIEWLYEALSIEYTVTALAGTINARWLYADHRKSGYHVLGHGDKAQVLIRVFYCDKLD